MMGKNKLITHSEYDIYICSSLRNHELNTGLCQFLESEQFTVYNPGRDTPQDSSQQAIFETNCNAINNSKIILAVLDYFGKDFGFEIGYARATGKIIVGYLTGELSDNSTMILQAIPDIVSSYQELKKKIVPNKN